MSSAPVGTLFVLLLLVGIFRKCILFTKGTAVAPYLTTAKGGGSLLKQHKTKDSINFDVSSVGGGIINPAQHTQEKEINTALTEALEQLCTTQASDSPAFYYQVDQHIRAITNYCRAREECWLAPFVRGVQTQNWLIMTRDREGLAALVEQQTAQLNVFQYIDKNEDYLINEEEHHSGLCKLAQKKTDELCYSDSHFVRQVQAEFKRSDRNRNGFITFDEFPGPKSKDYSLLRMPFLENPIVVPVFSFFLHMYQQTYHYSLRQILLLLTKVLVRLEPIPADMKQQFHTKKGPKIVSPSQLGILPVPMHALISFPLDLTLNEAILMRGSGSYRLGLASHESDNDANFLRPFMLSQDKWGKTGTATRKTPAGVRAAKKENVVPCGISFLSMLRVSRNDDTTVGIVKVLFMAMDTLNSGIARSTREGFLLMSSDSNKAVRTDQGHSFKVVYQSVHSISQTFQRWEMALDENRNQSAVIHRAEVIRILEECNIFLLKLLVQTPDTKLEIAQAKEANASIHDIISVRDTISPTSVHVPMRSAYGDANPLAADLRAAYKLDLNEIKMTALDSGRNILHDIAIAGQSNILKTICDLVLDFDADTQDEYKKSFLAAMSHGAMRLGRTPFHFATLWYGFGEIYNNFKRCVTIFGGDMGEYLSIKDDSGFTPTDYAQGLHQLDLVEDVAKVRRIYDAVVAADEVAGLHHAKRQARQRYEQSQIKKPSTKSIGWASITKQKSQSSTTTEDSSIRSLPEGNFDLDDGGWNDLTNQKPQHGLEYLYDMPLAGDPKNSVKNVTAAAESLSTKLHQGGRSLNIEIFEGAPTREQMTAVVNSHRPILFRGAIRDFLLNRSVWNRERFQKKYGHLDVTIADIPYRSTFSSLLNGTVSEKSVKMREYVENFGTDKHVENGVPLYMFSQKFTQENPHINKECRGLLDFMNSIPGIQELNEGQFFVGDVGTGAPVHFHSSAINALYYGRKRWILIPPMQSFYSVKPAAMFLKKDIEAVRQTYDTYEFIQEAGDLVYVPDYYGHGTVNLGVSIGIAFEFENFNSKLYNTDVERMRQIQVTAPGTYRSLQYNFF